MVSTWKSVHCIAVLAASLAFTDLAYAGTITTQGDSCIALTDIVSMTVIEGTATFDEGPVSGDIPLETYAPQGLHLRVDVLASLLPGVDAPGESRQPEYATPDALFPGPIDGGGTQAGQVAIHAAAVQFDGVVTRVGLTASQNDTQYLTAWDTDGNMIGQVTWDPDVDSAFIGIDCIDIPLGLVTYGNDDMWNGATYDAAGSTIFSDTWVWSGDTSCGNGMIGGAEECDDGNHVNTDDCVIGCQSAACGDNFLLADVEECDDGNVVDTDDCTAACTTAFCGDGIVWQFHETCDDGNDDVDDGCIGCVVGYCGDGFVNVGVEECDDANDYDEDECHTNCFLAGCGDEIVQDDEECDDGNDDATDACTNECTVAYCGDGVVREVSEECDDGNANQTDDCAMCAYARCGDGFVHANIEECDDGNDLDTDECLTDCTLPQDAEDSSGGDTTSVDESSDSGGDDSGGDDITGGSNISGSGDETTGTAPGTDESSDSGSSAAVETSGCSCDAGGSSMRGAWLGLVLFAIRRRRAA